MLQDFFNIVEHGSTASDRWLFLVLFGLVVAGIVISARWIVAKWERSEERLDAAYTNHQAAMEHILQKQAEREVNLATIIAEASSVMKSVLKEIEHCHRRP